MMGLSVLWIGYEFGGLMRRIDHVLRREVMF